MTFKNGELGLPLPPESETCAEPAVSAVEVRRSIRRSRTVSARVEDGTLILLLPARTSAAEEAMWVDKMKSRFEARRRKRSMNLSGDLEARARELNKRYFGGKLDWRSISYVTNQRSRYGSCSTREATIRLSETVAGMPGWVRDYVIIHELAHLIVPNHSRRFWSLVDAYPLSERAKGYLIAKGMES